MTHPLFTLMSKHSQQLDTSGSAPESPQAASGTSLADLSPVAAEGQQAKRGEAGGGGAGGGGGVVAVAGTEKATPPNPWYASPGLVILAVQDPPGPPKPRAINQPGRTVFVPGLTLADKREILFDIEFFDNQVRRREPERMKKIISEE